MRFLNDEIEQEFVGQTRALRVVREQLSDFINVGDDGDGPLVLHLIGPSGTGKTFLAELIARAFFDDCDSTLAKLLGGAAFGARQISRLLPDVFPGGGGWLRRIGDAVAPFFERRCDDKSRLATWRQACGVVETRFHYSEDQSSGETTSNENNLRAFLDRAAAELLHEPRSVLILDDFNFCGRACVSMLKDLMLSRSVTGASGKTASAARALVIICSDLTDFGLTLDPAQSYESALAAVETATQDYWGRDSPVISKAVLVPFSPLSEAEFLRIVHQIVARAAALVRRRVDRHLALRSHNEARGYSWEGSFTCSEMVKQEVVDRLHRKTQQKNARALTEELMEALKRAALKPQPVEKRLSGFKAAASGALVSVEDVSVHVLPGEPLKIELRIE